MEHKLAVGKKRGKRVGGGGGGVPISKRAEEIYEKVEPTGKGKRGSAGSEEKTGRGVGGERFGSPWRGKWGGWELATKQTKKTGGGKEETTGGGGKEQSNPKRKKACERAKLRQLSRPREEGNAKRRRQKEKRGGLKAINAQGRVLNQEG